MSSGLDLINDVISNSITFDKEYIDLIEDNFWYLVDITKDNNE